METFTSLISSRGILKSCHAHNINPISSNSHIDLELLNHHRLGESIYICTDAIANFSTNFLDLIQAPFVLVTGDSDLAITHDLINETLVSDILENKLLLRWYAQNLATKHPKLFPLPIGLDYHTMWEKPGFWGLTAVSALAQETSLLNTLASSPQFSQRYLTCYCNWHFASHRGDRNECLGLIDKSICFFEKHPMTRASTWSRQAECMFVISPEGAGMDCHRTWEAILLGCIPIVKRSSISSLFDDLPVLLIDDWQQIDKEFLLKFASESQSTKYNFSPLFRETWMRYINGIIWSRSLQNMTFTEFRTMLTRVTG